MVSVRRLSSTRVTNNCTPLIMTKGAVNSSAAAITAGGIRVSKPASQGTNAASARMAAAA